MFYAFLRSPYHAIEANAINRSIRNDLYRQACIDNTEGLKSTNKVSQMYQLGTPDLSNMLNQSGFTSRTKLGGLGQNPSVGARARPVASLEKRRTRVPIGARPGCLGFLCRLGCSLLLGRPPLAHPFGSGCEPILFFFVGSRLGRFAFSSFCFCGAGPELDALRVPPADRNCERAELNTEEWLLMQWRGERSCSAALAHVPDCTHSTARGRPIW